MNQKQLFESMSQIDDSLLEMTEQTMKPKKKSIWPKWIAAAACACLLLGAFLFPWDKLLKTSETQPNRNPILVPYLITEARYPTVPSYPDPGDYYDKTSVMYNEEYNKLHTLWWDDWRSKRLEGNEKNQLDDFLVKTIPSILSGSEQENIVYSPLNVYMALAMLAETTDGNSRQQILDVLGQEDLTSLRSQMDRLWNATYRNDGYVSTILANSFWLNDTISYKEDTFQTLADQYYASSFIGEMGSEEYNLAYQNWLNDQTKGLLKDQIDTLEMDPETVLSLASTIYYSACWYNKFDPAKNTTDVFHAPTGDTTEEFMNDFTHEFYFRGEHFGAINWMFDQAGSMWLLLPDEGYTPEDILTDESMLAFYTDPSQALERMYVELTLALPKFDVNSKLDLKDSMINLGITDVFDLTASDFSPVTDETDIMLSKIQHGARVRIDEEGCEGVAYTTELLCGAPQLEGKVDFILNRPFMFLITSDDNLPLFIGIVNNP